VVLVGVDGASWQVMGPMIEGGELPAFARLLREGASHTAFDTLKITRSPVVWTTVATGQPPQGHGVQNYTERLPDGAEVPITSNSRKVPALWNVASAAGKSVAVINWWASWPAEELRGAIVSDHANPVAFGWMQGRYWTADPAALSAQGHDVWPRDLGAVLQKDWLDPAAFPAASFQAEAGLSDPQWQALLAAPYNERSTWSWFRTFQALDQPHAAIAARWLRQGIDGQTAADPSRPAPDLLMLYLRGPDPVQHYAWDTVVPESYASPTPDLERDRGVVQAVYRATDARLGELMAALPPETTLLVLSDHGAEPCPEASDAARTTRPGCHTRAAKGVFFAWGPGVRAGRQLAEGHPQDIAPTVAWLLGLPVAEDLPGEVLEEAFSAEWRARRGRQEVATWGERPPTITLSTASPADATMMEQLRGLGYVE
jgi:hypothetical protein